MLEKNTCLIFLIFLSNGVVLLVNKVMRLSTEFSVNLFLASMLYVLLPVKISGEFMIRFLRYVTLNITLNCPKNNLKKKKNIKKIENVGFLNKLVIFQSTQYFISKKTDNSKHPYIDITNILVFSTYLNF